MEKYRLAAEQVREIISKYDPSFDSGGLDEAYLNIT